MSPGLRLTIGQHSDKGRKESNQDFHGALLPDEPVRSSKGIAVALGSGKTYEVVSVVILNALRNGRRP